MTCYYKILNVVSSATYSEIKSAYRKKAIKCHPDRGGSHAEMVKVNEAWEVLSNPELRKQYDQLLKQGADVNGQFADARKRAESYPKSWDKFDQWFSAIGRDFTDANYGSTEFAGIRMPTSGSSITGWLFILAGGILGLCLAGYLYTVFLPEPKPIPNLFGDGELRTQRQKHNPILARILFVGLGAAGAWLGRLLHGGAGSIIGRWFTKIVSSMPFDLSRDSIAASTQSSEPTSHEAEQEAKHIIPCPNCQQKLNLPSVHRAGFITCPKCRHRFENPKPTPQPKSNSMQFPPSKNVIARIFKGLLIAEIAIVAFQFQLLFIENSIIEHQGLIIESDDSNIFLSAMLFLMFVVILAALVTSWVGLFRYRRWARWLYAGTLLAAIATFVPSSCFDLSVNWGFSSSVSDIGSYITGSLLTIMFLTPLADEFRPAESAVSQK